MKKKIIAALLLLIFLSLSAKVAHERIINAFSPSGEKVIYHDKVLILIYHHLQTMQGSDLSITPQLFEEHMKYLKDNGYNVIPLSQAVNFIEGKGDVPANAVALTFDDGYYSFYEYVFPVLKKYNFPASVFVIVGEVGNQSAVPPLMTWDQMRELLKSKLVAFYPHTYKSHWVGQIDDKGNTGPLLVSRLYLTDKKRLENEKEYKARIKEDLFQAKNVLEKELNVSAPYFAYPFGKYNSALIEAAREAGYKYMFTTTPGINKKGGNINKIYRVNAGNRKLSVEKLDNRLKLVAWWSWLIKWLPG